MRIGHGYDVHEFFKDRRLILGGVQIDYNMGLIGHSDADVLVHAIMDSLIGAAALGDIGKIFPDNLPEYKDASSIVMLKEVYNIINNEGYRILNIDSTVIAQAPRLSNYIYFMRENISRACNINIEMVSVKSTTEEGLGFTGNLEGIAAHSVCLLDNKQ